MNEFLQEQVRARGAEPSFADADRIPQRAGCALGARSGPRDIVICRCVVTEMTADWLNALMPPLIEAVERSLAIPTGIGSQPPAPGYRWSLN